MRGTPLTRIAVMQELLRVLEVYKRPDHLPADTDAMARIYFDVLEGGCSAEQLHQAVTEYLKSASLFFPKPGQLLALAREQAGASGAETLSLEQQYWTWWRNGLVDPAHATLKDGHGNVVGVRFAPCPVCGETPTWEKRIAVQCDPIKHRLAGFPWVPRRDPAPTPAAAPTEAVA